MDKQILFRASKVGLLMGEPKLIKDKEAGNLSQTAKSFVEEVWELNEFNYSEPLFTDEMMKGQLCEQDAMALVQEVANDGIFREKFKGGNLKNDFISGSPDIVIIEHGVKVVEDTKCSFTLSTFRNAELTNLYEWQLRCYMWLLGAQKARLRFCLVDTPESIILELKKRFYYRFNCDEDNKDYIKASQQIEYNHNPSKWLTPVQRLKTFEIEHDESKIDLLKLKILKAREYYNTITL